MKSLDPIGNYIRSESALWLEYSEKDSLQMSLT